MDMRLAVSGLVSYIQWKLSSVYIVLGMPLRNRRSNLGLSTYSDLLRRNTKTAFFFSEDKGHEELQVVTVGSKQYSVHSLPWQTGGKQ